MLICVGIVLSLCIIFLADRLLGIYFTVIGYTKGITPNTTVTYDTNEFTAVAHISSQGVRNQIVSIPKPPNTYRILTLGDSFTFGWGVNDIETWPKLLEKNLKILGKRVEVINAGVPGIELTKETQVCQAYATRFNVDAILLEVYPDDFPQIIAINSVTTSQTIWEKVFPNFLTILTHPIIEDTSWGQHVMSPILTSYYWKKEVQDITRYSPTVVNGLDSKTKELFLEGKIEPTRVLVASQDKNFLIHILNPEYMKVATTLYMKQLAIFKSVCGKSLPVVFIFIPSNEMVNKSIFPYRQAYGYTTDSGLLSFKMDQLLEKMLKPFNFFYISLLSNFRQDGCPNCYYHFDEHLTKAGNQHIEQYLLYPIENILEKRKTISKS